MPRTRARDLPDTIRRSSAKAQRTFAKALDAAHEQYGGDEERAHRTAYSALKHSFEKVGGRWKEKRHRGPSDPRARRGRGGGGRSAGGVDVEGSTRAELYERAKQAGVRGRSRMSKLDLGRALSRKEG